jgi:hypothetical protein
MCPLCGLDGAPPTARYHCAEPLMTAPPADEPPRQAVPEPPDGDALDGAGAPDEAPTETVAEVPPAPRRRLFRRRPITLSGEEGPAPAVGALRRRRRALTQRRQEAVYHLGGLAFELYRRERLPAGVMHRKAAEVAEIDRTVGEIDGLLEAIDRSRREQREARRITEPAAAAEIGCCLRCRAGFAAEAHFCWRCGVAVVPVAEVSEQVTVVIADDERGRR